MILVSYMTEVNGLIVAVLVIAALLVMLIVNYIRKHNIAAILSPFLCTANETLEKKLTKVK